MAFLEHDQDAVFYQRFEAIMRPLSEQGHGPDHDRLRQLYVELLEQCVGDPLEQARRIVLKEILQSYLRNHATLPGDTVQSVIQSTKLAIGSLVLLMCRLEEGNLEAAAVSLEATHQALDPVNAYLNKTFLNKISAAPERLTS